MCSNSKVKKTNTLIKIIIPVVAVIVALGITITVIAVNNADITKNTQSENMSTSASATIVSTNHIYTVPDTVGMDYEKALLLLKESGFTVESEEEYNDNIEYGHVIRQSVQAGKQFEIPQIIKLVVSKGKEKKDVSSSDASSNISNSDNFSSNNVNREFIDYDSDNNHVENSVSESENTENNGNASNSNNSKNDNDNSVIDPPDQSSNEDKRDIDKGIDEISQEDYEIPFIPN